MKLKIALSVILLSPVSMAYAETTVVDSQKVCAERIQGYKTGLESAIEAKQNVEAARAELDQINKLPRTLTPCDKQKRIPALANTDETLRQTNEALKDRKISP
jgi:hypothetical protein